MFPDRPHSGNEVSTADGARGRFSLRSLFGRVPGSARALIFGWRRRKIGAAWLAGRRLIRARSRGKGRDPGKSFYTSVRNASMSSPIGRALAARASEKSYIRLKVAGPVPAAIAGVT